MVSTKLPAIRVNSFELFCGIKRIHSDRVRGRARAVLQLGSVAQRYPLRWYALDEPRKQFELGKRRPKSSYGQSAQVATLVDIVGTISKTGSSWELVEIHLWRCV